MSQRVVVVDEHGLCDLCGGKARCVSLPVFDFSSLRVCGSCLARAVEKLSGAARRCPNHAPVADAPVATDVFGARLYCRACWELLSAERPKEVAA